MSETIDTDLLPQSVKPIAERIGLPKTIRLLESYGGGRIYIPRTLADDHPLVGLLGRDAAEALARYYDGESPELPICPRLIRDRVIIRRFDAGESADSLAREYRTSRRNIFRIVKRMRDPEGGEQIAG